MTHAEASQHQAGLILSRLFLDTDISDEIDLLSQQLAALPVSIPEIEHVLIHQVYPVCWRNLATPAGVWDGFDPDWLKQHFCRRRSRISRAFYGYFGKRFAAQCEHWKTIKKLIEERRIQA